MNYLAYLIVFGAAAYWLLVTIVGVLSVRKMRNPEALLEQVHEPERLEDAQGISAWARAQDFALDSQFDFDSIIGCGGIKLAVEGWYSPARKCFLMHYHAADKSYYEFVSTLEGGYSLSSSGSADSLSLPFPPGVFTQAFEGMPLDELLREHEKALAFFRQRFGVEPAAPDQPLRDLLLEAVKAQMHYVQSQPLWYLQIAWWHLVRRRIQKNKSVIEQIERLDKDQ
ncbi:hypothetical protein [Thiolapillus sp.]